MAWNPIFIVGSGASTANEKIVLAIETWGVLVTFLGKFDSNNDPVQHKCFKFDYERDIAAPSKKDAGDLEMDVTIMYFEASANSDIQEGSRIQMPEPDNEIFIIQGRIHRQFDMNGIIYVNAPVFRFGDGDING